MLCAQHPEKEHKRKPKYYTHNNCEGNNLAQLPGKNEFKKKKKKERCVSWHLSCLPSPPSALFISDHKFRFTSRRHIISHRERCADHQPAPGAEGHHPGLGTLHMHTLQCQSDVGARAYRRWWVARYAKRFGLPKYECCPCSPDVLALRKETGWNHR